MSDFEQGDLLHPLPSIPMQRSKALQEKSKTKAKTLFTLKCERLNAPDELHLIENM